jgi:hypothetical protein
MTLSIKYLTNLFYYGNIRISDSYFIVLLTKLDVFFCAKFRFS